MRSTNFSVPITTLNLYLGRAFWNSLFGKWFCCRLEMLSIVLNSRRVITSIFRLAFFFNYSGLWVVYCYDSCTMYLICNIWCRWVLWSLATGRAMVLCISIVLVLVVLISIVLLIRDCVLCFVSLIFFPFIVYTIAKTLVNVLANTNFQP